MVLGIFSCFTVKNKPGDKDKNNKNGNQNDALTPIKKGPRDKNINLNIQDIGGEDQSNFSNS